MTTTKTKVQMHREICEEINDLYARKNHDYGDSFHQTFVEEGMAMARIRLGDKFNRFKTLSRSGEQKVDDESIRDTLIDLANYAIMTVLEMEVAGHDGQSPGMAALHQTPYRSRRSPGYAPDCQNAL